MDLSASWHKLRNALGGLVALIAMLIPTLVSAQTATLRVTLRDSGGQAITGVSVSVRGEDGQELGQGSTDSVGEARFRDLPAVVRVVVAGQPRGGPRLYQLGDDVQGVRIVLKPGAEPTVLDLRAERDGLVLPDPTTMITREEGGPLVVDAPLLPTAAIATPAPLPTAPHEDAATTVTVGAAPADEPRRTGWIPLATVLIIGVAAGVMLLIQRRRSSL